MIRGRLCSKLPISPIASPAATLLENASASIPTGHKAGLVGPNGAGKSTLLKLLVGALVVDGGEVGMTTGARLGSVAQEMPGGSRSLLDTVLAADTERASLLDEAEALESPDYDGDPMRIAFVHQRLADIDAHRAPARAAEILAGLGFDDAAQNRACSEFSGGWRMRVALAAALFAGPRYLDARRSRPTIWTSRPPSGSRPI